MRVGNFSVVIPEGVERETGHVALDHGRQYTIRLMNHEQRQADAEVTVDGKSIGGFRLYANGSLTLERSPEDHGRFTFYTRGTAEAGQAGESAIAIPDKGLVQVRFIPEIRQAPIPTSTPVLKARSGPMGIVPQSAGAQSIPQHLEREEKTSGGGFGFSGFAPEEKTAGGITGLSGHSNQQFRNVADINRSEPEAVTISIRLVTLDNSPRPLKSAPERANPVPNPVS